MIFGGHEVFAADLTHQFQHGFIQHIPGANLLFDHVETSLRVHIARVHLGVHWQGHGYLRGKDLSGQTIDSTSLRGFLRRYVIFWPVRKPFMAQPLGKIVQIAVHHGHNHQR